MARPTWTTGVLVRLIGPAGGRVLAVLLVPLLLAAGAGQPDVARAGTTLSAPGTTPSAEQPPPLAVAAGPAPDSDRDLAVGTPRRQERATRAGVRLDRATPAEARGQQALDALDYDWRALGYRVRFLPYDGRALGTANRQARLITVYVMPRQSELSLRTSLAHELGHALDFTYGTEQRRDAYRRIRGLERSSPWFPCNRCDDLRSPAGDFAEVFATWLVGPGDFRSRVKGPPSQEQLRQLDPLFQVPRARAAPSSSPSPAVTASPRATRPPAAGLPVLVGAPSPPPTRP